MIVPTILDEYRDLPLTLGECVVLDTLFRTQGAVSRERIRCALDIALHRIEVRGEPSIEPLICHLRGKLRRLDPPVAIATLYGFGYRLGAEARAQLSVLRIAASERRHANVANRRERS